MFVLLSTLPTFFDVVIEYLSPFSLSLLWSKSISGPFDQWVDFLNCRYNQRERESEVRDRERVSSKRRRERESVKRDRERESEVRDRERESVVTDRERERASSERHSERVPSVWVRDTERERVPEVRERASSEIQRENSAWERESIGKVLSTQQNLSRVDSSQTTDWQQQHMVKCFIFDPWNLLHQLLTSFCFILDPVVCWYSAIIKFAFNYFASIVQKQDFS